VAKQTSLSHVSLFSFATTSIVHGIFEPDPIVFFYRNMFALVVSLINCIVRLIYSNKHEQKREIYLDMFTLWLFGGLLLYTFSGIEFEEVLHTKLAILVGAASNFNVYSSVFPLVLARDSSPAVQMKNRFTFVALFPLVVNSANSIVSVLYSMKDVDGVNFYSNMIACIMCMITYVLFFNDKQIHLPGWRATVCGAAPMGIRLQGLAKDKALHV